MRNTKNTKRKTSRRRNEAIKSGKKITILLVGLLLLLLAAEIFMASQKNEQYKNREKQLKAQIKEEQLRAEELEELETYVGTDEYVENEARGKVGMVNPDEILFIEE